MILMYNRWQLNSKKVIHKAKFVVEEHEVTTKDGRTFKMPVLLTGSGSSMVCAVMDDGRIALVKQHRYAADRITVELPAGSIDDGDTPMQAAIRELYEETGIIAGKLVHLSSNLVTGGIHNEVGHYYIATQCVLDDKALPDLDTVPVFMEFDEALKHPDLTITSGFGIFLALQYLSSSNES